MPSLSDTLAQLAAMKAGRPLPGASAAMDRLTDLREPFRNPGALAARCFVPPNLPAGASLVVALHGCTQNAAGYDHGSGWSTLAEREGFALLLPEQVRSNNANLCFNWFEPSDIVRVGGEAESIAAMATAMIAEHDLDRSRVFVTGLSAGGAMTAVMLAAYPELFAGGAVIGGLPYGCAGNVSQAFEQMRARSGGDDAVLANAVRRAADGHAGPWPSLAIWHGTADATVNAANMDRLGRQWRRVHGLGDQPSAYENGPGWTRRIWRGDDERVAVEEWSVDGMGHGVPIDPAGPEGLGASAPFMLDVGLSSTAAIAYSWGLIDIKPALSGRRATATSPAAKSSLAGLIQNPKLPTGVGKVIEDALRAGGLVR